MYDINSSTPSPVSCQHLFIISLVCCKLCFPSTDSFFNLVNVQFKNQCCHLFYKIFFFKVVNYDGVSKNVTAVGFHEDGKWMYTGGEDCSARIWDLR